jgi:hypothetical protein
MQNPKREKMCLIVEIKVKRKENFKVQSSDFKHEILYLHLLQPLPNWGRKRNIKHR